MLLISWLETGGSNDTLLKFDYFGRIARRTLAVYLLDHWFIIGGYNPGTDSWKRCIGRGRWEGVRSSHAECTILPESPRVH